MSTNRSGGRRSRRRRRRGGGAASFSLAWAVHHRQEQHSGSLTSPSASSIVPLSLVLAPRRPGITCAVFSCKLPPLRSLWLRPSIRSRRGVNTPKTIGCIPSCDLSALFVGCSCVLFLSSLMDAAFMPLDLCLRAGVLVQRYGAYIAIDCLVSGAG